MTRADDTLRLARPAPLPPGTAVGDYLLEAAIEPERGAYRVYTATLTGNRRLGRLLPVHSAAVKVFGPLGSETAQREFEDAAATLMGLNDPHAVPVHEAGRWHLGSFLSMELVRGGTLDSLLRAGGPLDPRRTLRVLGPLGDLLDRAARVGLLHQDLSPYKVLVIPGRDRALLTDFGIGRAVTQNRDDLALAPDAGYAAPERAAGGPMTVAAQVHAFAGLVYTALTGTPPPAGDAERQESLPGLPVAVDERLEDVLTRGLDEDPARRPSSAGEIVDALRASVLGRSARASRSGDAGDRELTMRWGAGTPAAAPSFVTSERAAEPTAARVLPAPRDRRPARRPLSRVAVLVGVVAAGLAAGFLVAGRGSDTASQTNQALRTASAGPIQISVPADWRTGENRLARFGLAPRGGLALEPPPYSGSSGIVIGMTPGVGPSLLATELSDRLARDPANDDAVAVGDVQALRHSGLEVRGLDFDLTVYAVPTDRGVATAACFADPALAPRFLARCEQAVATLSVADGAKPFPLDAPGVYVSRLDRAMARLDRERVARRRDLRDARTPRGQAVAASRLATASTAAARSLPRSVTPAVEPLAGSIRVALRSIASAYSEMATAADRGDRNGFASARRKVTRREAKLQSLLARARRML